MEREDLEALAAVLSLWDGLPNAGAELWKRARGQSPPRLPEVINIFVRGEAIVWTIACGEAITVVSSHVSSVKGGYEFSFSTVRDGTRQELGSSILAVTPTVSS